jgi:hypothetical protein
MSIPDDASGRPPGSLTTNTSGLMTPRYSSAIG